MGKKWGASRGAFPNHMMGSLGSAVYGFGQQLADLITTASTLDKQSLCDVMKSYYPFFSLLRVFPSVFAKYPTPSDHLLIRSGRIGP